MSLRELPQQQLHAPSSHCPMVGEIARLTQPVVQHERGGRG